MNTFKEKYAYKVSLWTVLILSVLVISDCLDFLEIALSFTAFALVMLMIPTRLLSKDSSKKWKDIIFIFAYVVTLALWYTYMGICMVVYSGFVGIGGGPALPSICNYKLLVYFVGGAVPWLFFLAGLFFNIKYLFFEKEENSPVVV